MAMVAVVS